MLYYIYSNIVSSSYHIIYIIIYTAYYIMISYRPRRHDHRLHGAPFLADNVYTYMYTRSSRFPRRPGNLARDEGSAAAAAAS